MLDFNRIVDEVCRGPSVGIRTASRNHYEWSLANGMRTGDRVRLADGREGNLTAPFPGCLGDGDWCGIFLADGTEENIRPDRVASIFDKVAGWKPLGGKKVAEEGRTVRYVVEFRDHGTDHMSANMTKDENGLEDDGSGGEFTTGDHDRSSKLLQAIVQFEADVAGSQAESGSVESVESVGPIL